MRVTRANQDKHAGAREPERANGTPGQDQHERAHSHEQRDANGCLGSEDHGENEEDDTRAHGSDGALVREDDAEDA